MNSHFVRLPHPDRAEPTLGTCECGWRVIYGWGMHGDAVAAAKAHIEATAMAEAIDVGEVCGDRLVLPGASL